MTYAIVPRCALVGAITLVALSGHPSWTQAQEATPQGETVARPVHIHAGTCEELGAIVYPLTPLQLPQGPPVGNVDAAMSAATSYTPLQVPLDEILAGQHAINVHLSDERIEEYIACGEIGGALTEQGALVIALQEQNASGFAGVAFLSPNAPAPTAASDVSVFLIPLEGQAARLPSEEADRAATPVAEVTEGTPTMGDEEAILATPRADAPMATPERTDAEGAEEAVVAPAVDDGAGFATVDLADPSRVHITAGEELTVVNSGLEPRSFTVPELGIDQVVTPGETVSVPLETPGNYRLIVREGGVEVDNQELVVE